MLKAEDSVLILIDVQGKLAQIVHQSDQLIETLATLIQAAELFDIPILWVEQLPDKLGSTTPKLAELLQSKCQVITKSHFSAWQAEQFRDALNSSGRKQLLITGIETHICVYQTCRDLLEQDFNVHVVVDGVSSRTLENKQLGVEMMTQYGAKLTNCESLLFELQQQAQEERFKQLLKMIK